MENKIINYINQTPENTNQSVLATLLSGLNEQSDWNQNDTEQPDYVKNRTHSSNPKYVFQGTSYPVWPILRDMRGCPFRK